MAIQQELFNNLVIIASTTVYSQAVDLAGNSNVFVALTMVTGATALSSSTALEQSSDLSNWTSLATTWAPATFAAAPTFYSATATGVAARYVRLKVVTGAGAVRVNASLTASAG